MAPIRSSCFKEAKQNSLFPLHAMSRRSFVEGGPCWSDENSMTRKDLLCLQRLTRGCCRAGMLGVRFRPLAMGFPEAEVL